MRNNQLHHMSFARLADDEEGDEEESVSGNKGGGRETLGKGFFPSL